MFDMYTLYIHLVCMYVAMYVTYETINMFICMYVHMCVFMYMQSFRQTVNGKEFQEFTHSLLYSNIKLHIISLQMLVRHIKF